jgi:ABC-2 type transport system ATP-binding protein
MSSVIETNGLGKRYGHKWALRDCTMAIPEGKVVGLVGPNGSGKTTLLNMAVGLLAPSEGEITVLGGTSMVPLSSRRSGSSLKRRRSTPGSPWRSTCAWGPISTATGTTSSLRAESLSSISTHGRRQKAGSLSGGQRAQLALTLAIARRPELLLLDEPVASLDPLARREFLQSLMEIVANDGVSVMLSSHLIADLERVCDYLVILMASRVRLFGEVAELVASHWRLSGPRRDPSSLPSDQEIIEESHTDRQSTFLVRTDRPILDPAWTVKPVTLEDLVLAYLSNSVRTERARPHGLGIVR